MKTTETIHRLYEADTTNGKGFTFQKVEMYDSDGNEDESEIVFSSYDDDEDESEIHLTFSLEEAEKIAWKLNTIVREAMVHEKLKKEPLI